MENLCSATCFPNWNTWRKLMLHLSLGFCSVFWKNVYVDPGITAVFQDCNLLCYSPSCLITSLQINPASFLRCSSGCPWGHVVRLSCWGCQGMSSMACRFISRSRSVSLWHLLLNTDFLLAVLEVRNLPGKNQLMGICIVFLWLEHNF